MTSIDSVGSLRNLENLTLRSITLPNLDLLRGNKKLRTLDLKLGGTKNFDVLPELPLLRSFEIWLVRGLVNLDVLAEMRGLQYLFLQSLKNVSNIPSLRTLVHLRRVGIQQLRGLKQLQTIADAPKLEELVALDMGHLTPKDFDVFKHHRSLKFATVGLGSTKKNMAVDELLGLPAVEKQFRFRTK